MVDDTEPRCPYCAAAVWYAPRVITVDGDARIQVLGDVARCDCGYVVLSPCTLLVIDEITRELRGLEDGSRRNDDVDDDSGHRCGAP